MNAHEPILVGTDGSEPAMAAVRWAAVEAHRRETTLTVLHAYDEPWPTMPGLPWQERSAGVDRAEAVVAEARQVVHRLAPAVTVHTAIVPGDPAAALLDQAGAATMVVVGHRGRGGFTSMLLGSVSHRVATRAAGPAVVVRGRTIAFTEPVTVGADDSPGGRLAIGTAFAVADARHATVLAVHAFREPLPTLAAGMPVILPAEPSATEKIAADALDDLLTPWRRRFPTVPVGTLLSPGSPARLLVSASHQAQLVVVGDHTAGRMTGSTAVQLLHHADCPVMIARGC